ncbi:hypothetical protein [Burkholderia sp. Bp8990]|uniref:hypothetical protein n=1 Tax=Burkholderia sp. Bp8990 TaxID=2184552 RepID=UPI000F5AEB02|nr:hypothetical protein [Burkholderia sp. Bp8990]
MTTRRPTHRDMSRPRDRSFAYVQETRLGVWLVYDGDKTPFAEVHLNERGGRTRSPRLVEACAILLVAGDLINLAEALAGEPLGQGKVLDIFIERARAVIAKKDGIPL